MHENTDVFKVRAVNGDVTIQRNKDGVPEVTADNREDLCFGIGYAHGYDRSVQMMLVKEIAYGRASEKFEGSDELIEIDKYMRWLNLAADLEQEVAGLPSDILGELEAYAGGINAAVERNRRPLEFLMVGYKPEPWNIKDCLITVKLMGFVGLAQAQGDMEKFLIQMVRSDVDQARIRALFPYLTEEIDYDLIQQINLIVEMVPQRFWQGLAPSIRASNNWAVSRDRTKSGQALLAGDPHMEVNRLPALWYEMVWKREDRFTMGITMPGVPCMIMGRHNDLAWAGTYGFMDMIDWFIEDCRDEEYLYDGKWLPFERRTETIRPRKREPITLSFYENHHGILEGDPKDPGKYLAMNFTARTRTGRDVLEGMMRIDEVKTVEEAQEKLRGIAAPTFNWVLADREGSIGYQMNGRMPSRPDGISGLLPIPGWDKTKDWQGFVDPAELPMCLNPAEGYFGTANDDLNEYGKADPINLPMGPYRAQRIRQMLAENDRVDPEYIKKMHFDLFSKQAERLMPLYAPLLPDTENGRILKEWGFTYTADSRAAMLFESVYLNTILVVFGKFGLGEDLVRYIFEETGLFSDYYGNFDDVLMDENSPWFQEVNRDAQLTEAIERGLSVPAEEYGNTRKYDLTNIFFGGKLPGFLGFDEKNRTLAGNRATIPQGQIFKNAGRVTTFSPSFRMIAELEKDEMWTNIAGGPSGKRFSRWYKSGLDDWEKGVYKLLR